MYDHATPTENPATNKFGLKPVKRPQPAEPKASVPGKIDMKNFALFSTPASSKPAAPAPGKIGKKSFSSFTATGKNDWKKNSDTLTNASSVKNRFQVPSADVKDEKKLRRDSNVSSVRNLFERNEAPKPAAKLAEKPSFQRNEAPKGDTSVAESVEKPAVTDEVEPEASPAPAAITTPTESLQREVPSNVKDGEKPDSAKDLGTKPDRTLSKASSVKNILVSPLFKATRRVSLPTKVEMELDCWDLLAMLKEEQNEEKDEQKDGNSPEASPAAAPEPAPAAPDNNDRKNSDNVAKAAPENNDTNTTEVTPSPVPAPEPKPAARTMPGVSSVQNRFQVPSADVKDEKKLRRMSNVSSVRNLFERNEKQDSCTAKSAGKPARKDKIKLTPSPTPAARAMPRVSVKDRIQVPLSDVKKEETPDSEKDLGTKTGRRVSNVSSVKNLFERGGAPKRDSSAAKAAGKTAVADKTKHEASPAPAPEPAPAARTLPRASSIKNRFQVPSADAKDEKKLRRVSNVSSVEKPDNEKDLGLKTVRRVSKVSSVRHLFERNEAPKRDSASAKSAEKPATTDKAEEKQNGNALANTDDQVSGAEAIKAPQRSSIVLTGKSIFEKQDDGQVTGGGEASKTEGGMKEKSNEQASTDLKTTDISVEGAAEKNTEANVDEPTAVESSEENRRESFFQKLFGSQDSLKEGDEPKEEADDQAVKDEEASKTKRDDEKPNEEVSSEVETSDMSGAEAAEKTTEVNVDETAVVESSEETSEPNFFQKLFGGQGPSEKGDVTAGEPKKEADEQVVEGGEASNVESSTQEPVVPSKKYAIPPTRTKQATIPTRNHAIIPTRSQEPVTADTTASQSPESADESPNNESKPVDSDKEEKNDHKDTTSPEEGNETNATTEKGEEEHRDSLLVTGIKMLFGVQDTERDPPDDGLSDLVNKLDAPIQSFDEELLNVEDKDFYMKENQNAEEESSDEELSKFFENAKYIGGENSAKAEVEPVQDNKPSRKYVMVTVPEGVEPGQRIHVRASTGQLNEVIVPPGMKPGSAFTVEFEEVVEENESSSESDSDSAAISISEFDSEDEEPTLSSKKDFSNEEIQINAVADQKKVKESNDALDKSHRTIEDLQQDKKRLEDEVHKMKLDLEEEKDTNMMLEQRLERANAKSGQEIERLSKIISELQTELGALKGENEVLKSQLTTTESQSLEGTDRQAETDELAEGDKVDLEAQPDALTCLNEALKSASNSDLESASEVGSMGTSERSVLSNIQQRLSQTKTILTPNSAKRRSKALELEKQEKLRLVAEHLATADQNEEDRANDGAELIVFKQTEAAEVPEGDKAVVEEQLAVQKSEELSKLATKENSGFTGTAFKESKDVTVGIAFWQANPDDPITISKNTGLFANTDIKVGMEVESINGTTIDGYTHLKAIGFIKEAEGELTVVGKAVKGGGVGIVFKDSKDQKVGITLKQDNPADPVTISGLWEDGLFSNTDLKVGMQVMSINNVPVEGLTKSQAVQMIKDTEGKVVVVGAPPTPGGLGAVAPSGVVPPPGVGDVPVGEVATPKQRNFIKRALNNRYSISTEEKLKQRKDRKKTRGRKSFFGGTRAPSG